MVKRFSVLIALTLMFFPLTAFADSPTPVHGIAMHGAPKYPADFTHFDYANPDAPKGGDLRLATIGTFDSLNSFIVKGVNAAGLGMIYQTLLTNAADEAFTEYGQIAKSIIVPEDRSSITFNLRKEAQWHDGKPLTSADVEWTFNALLEKGHPFYRTYYANVKEVKTDGPHRITFTFDDTNNRELPLIIGQMKILPKHYWTAEGHDLSETTLTPPLGSGPYKITKVKSPHSVTYERVKDWWATDLPVNKGRYNFDRIIYTYYKDPTVAIEGLFANEYDLREENIAKNWALSYNAPPVKDGRITKEEVDHQLPAGMQAFVYNTRRPIFADRTVREALSYTFDYEWSNKQFAFSAYKRSESFFSNSELASSGLPQGRELEILGKYRGKVPGSVFTTAFATPKNDGSGNNRKYLRKAQMMLEKAGYVLGADKIRTHKDTGVKLSFEILLVSPAFERWIQPMIQNLRKIGVQASIRLVDTTQYINRMNEFDFDMVVGTFGQSSSPGNEQREYWTSARANVPGARNLAGIKNPVIDELVEMVISAPDREELIIRTRALDRVLLAEHYVIPQWHINKYRLAYWNKFGKPAIAPKLATGIEDTWWVIDKDDEAAIQTAPELQIPVNMDDIQCVTTPCP